MGGRSSARSIARVSRLSRPALTPWCMAAAPFPNRRRHHCRYPARRGVGTTPRRHVRSRTQRAELATSMGGDRLGKVRVAIIGVGNCASALVQGVDYYRTAPDTDVVPGLMHVNLGGYHIG